MNGFPYLLILLLLPLAGAIVVAGMGGAAVRTVRLTAMAFAVLEFAFAVALWIDYRNFLTEGGGSNPFSATVSVEWIPSFGISFSLGVDGISLVMIALIGFLMPIVLGASWEERLPAGRTIGGYFALLLAMQCTMVGVFAATNVFLFYCFFEVMLIPMYFLIGYFGGPRRAYAATKFFLYSLLGGLLMLASVIGLYVASGQVLPSGTLDWAALRQIAGSIPESTQMWIFAGFAVAFAIKAPLVPLHTWLPDAGAEAPTGASTLLVTVLDKVGTFGFLRICLPLLPAASARLAWLFLLLALLGILYGAIVAAMQTDLKKFVTFTSIAHFGFIAMGVFVFTTQAMSGAVLYMLNHGIATGLLFIVVGMLIARGGSRQVADYGGVWKVAPLLGGVFLVATMATVALPGTNSFVSEFLVLIGAFARYPGWAIPATIGMIFAAVYMLWIFQRTMTGPVRGAAVVRPGQPAGPEGEVAVPAAATVPTGAGPTVAQVGPSADSGPSGAGLVAAAPAAVIDSGPDAHGPTRVRARFGDLTRREIAVVTPLVLAILFLGIYPKPVLDVINPTVTATMSSTGFSDPGTAVPAPNGGGK
ncbi:MAG TPA: NADH-quinone oxidoreductase subunit M [Nakamurella sp.]|nr:NADH-quinone oxidoreductase subunit M [Nakamurella sp.]